MNTWKGLGAREGRAAKYESLVTKSTRKRGSFVRYSLSRVADSNSCALVIRLRKEKRVVALPKVKFVDKNLSFQEVFTDVYDGDLDVRVKCRVGFKKPGDAEPKDFVSVDLAENVGAIVNALSANFVDFMIISRPHYKIETDKQDC